MKILIYPPPKKDMPRKIMCLMCSARKRNTHTLTITKARSIKCYFVEPLKELRSQRKQQSENEEKTAPQREWEKGSLQSDMSKVLGDDGTLPYLDSGEGFVTYAFVKAH